MSIILWLGWGWMTAQVSGEPNQHALLPVDRLFEDFERQQPPKVNTVQPAIRVQGAPITANTTEADLPVLAGDPEEDEVDWLEYDEAMARAAEDGKPVLLFVEAEWCVHCKRMREESFTRPDVGELIEEYYHPVSLDLDSREPLTFQGEQISERELARSLNVEITPTTFFLDTDEEIMGSREGYMDTGTMKDLFEFVVSDAFGEMSFSEYQERS